MDGLKQSLSEVACAVVPTVSCRVGQCLMLLSLGPFSGYYLDDPVIVLLDIVLSSFRNTYSLDPKLVFVLTTHFNFLATYILLCV
jgi:hypothetical protein